MKKLKAKICHITVSKTSASTLIVALICFVCLAFPYYATVEKQSRGVYLPKGGDSIRNSAEVFNESVPVSATERALSALTSYIYTEDMSQEEFVKNPAQGYEIFLNRPFVPKKKSALDGRRILILGDSTAAAVTEHTGVAFLIEQATGAAVYNCAIGGTFASLLNDEKRSDYYIAFYNFPVIAAAYAARDFGVVPDTYLSANMFPKLDLSLFDCLVLQYGTNDAMLGVEIGEADYNPNTFAGGLSYGIGLLKKAYPKLEILVVSPYYTDYAKDSEIAAKKELYVKALLSTVEKMSVHSVDAYNGLPINKQNREQYLPDEVHLNEQGRAIFAELISNKLIEIFEDK